MKERANGGIMVDRNERGGGSREDWRGKGGTRGKDRERVEGGWVLRRDLRPNI